MIHIWRGFHHHSLQNFILETWNNDDLLIICPPLIQENKFEQFRFLPSGEIKLHCLNSPFNIKLEKRSNSTWEGKPSPKLGVFTSGSTGTNNGKLVFYTRENILLAIDNLYPLFNLEKIKQVHCFPQPFHCFGLLIGYYFSFLHQKQLIFSEGPYGPASLHEWVKNTDENTITLGVPTHFKDLINFVKKFKAPIKDSYAAVLSSSKVDTVLWHNLQKALKIQSQCISYGATETSGAIINLPPGIPPSCDGDIGQLIPSAKIEFSNDGDFYISGPSVCLAVASKDEILFPQKIQVKDHLEYDESKKTYLYKGRSDFVLNRAGTKFIIEDIESFFSHFLSLSFALGTYSHPRLGEELIIYIEDTKQNQLNFNICDIQKEIFNYFKVSFEDTLCIHVEKIPKSPSGKINRKALMLNPNIQKALPFFKK